jgi:hypothetical protein
MEHSSKEYNKALKQEVSPLLIGLRNEIKNLIAEVALLRAERKAQDTETATVVVDNPVKSVDIRNPAPDYSQHLENVEVAVDEQTERLERSLVNFGEYMKSTGFGMQTLFKQLKDKVFAVEIKNPTTEVTVKNLADIKIDVPTSVRISNSTPSEAIPVILTSKDRKRFYEVLTALSDAGAKANVSVGDINANLDEVEAVLTSILAYLDTTLTQSLADLQEQVLQSSTGLGAYDINVHVANSDTILGGQNLTVCTYTVPSGNFRFVIQGVGGEGLDDGLWELWVDGTSVWRGRNSWTNRTLFSALNFDAPVGAVVSLQVENTKNQPSDYSGMFFGVLRTEAN